MDRNKLTLISLAIMFLIGILSFELVSAEVQTLSPQKAGTCIDLPQVCSSCTYVNISSIKYPNSSITILNQAMTKNEVNYNYTICNVTDLGTYVVTTCGDIDGTFECAVYDFEVTTDGTKPTDSQGTMFIGILASILVLSFFFGYLSFKFLEKENSYPIGLFFLLLAIMLSIYSIYLGVVYSRDYLSLTISSPQSVLFNGILYSMIGMIFISLLFFVINVVKEIRERKSAMNYGDNWDAKARQYN